MRTIGRLTTRLSFAVDMPDVCCPLGWSPSVQRLQPVELAGSVNALHALPALGPVMKVDGRKPV